MQPLEGVAPHFTFSCVLWPRPSFFNELNKIIPAPTATLSLINVGEIKTENFIKNMSKHRVIRVTDRKQLVMQSEVKQSVCCPAECLSAHTIPDFPLLYYK